MNTSSYISPDIILSTASAMVGDREYKVLSKGFYQSLIQQAFEALALDTFFDERRHDEPFPEETLTISLPPGCFNLRNVYIFTGDKCNIADSRKVYWKRNYYSEGKGYIANDKGNHNHNDPFYSNHTARREEMNSDRRDNLSVENRLYYNIQMGNIIFSSSCRGLGAKIHFHYNGTGCDIGETPIIPIYLRRAMEDFVIEAALRFRMANDPVNARTWQSLQQMYDKRLNDPINGSWQNAEIKVKSLNSSQREELIEYLGRPAWGLGR